MVSIIVPCYNYGRYLPACLESIEKNGYDDYEIIVVDDCSALDLIAPAIVQIPRCTFIGNKTNLGVAGTINVGIRASKGDFIMVLSADDMIVLGTLGQRNNILLADPDLDVIYGAMAEIHGDMGYVDALKTLDHFEAHPSRFTVPLYKRRVFQKFGLYHEPLRSREDKEYQYRLGVHAKSYCKPRVKFARVDWPVYFYRRHEGAQRKRRAKDLMFDIQTCMIFDSRCKDVEINGITADNTEFLV
jgi:glycosyltransferase involved in cell wall biosynthesis